ncbi:MAG: glycerophosphodiester phosphodiesterase [Treponema sp.]|jgi:glycerophosphoryl diester phosphodiesterase|nr:glycerophosphodiester phosphodiesterase [Treponema sp.]
MKNLLNITAHSGCDGTERDSLESVRRGIRFGADAVEVDVRLDKGGLLILSHDKEESRDYPGHARLADVFSLALENGSLAVNCDVKEREAVPAILRLGAEMGMEKERLILTGSSSPAMLRENPGMVKAASFWLNVEELEEDYYRAGRIEPLIAACLGLGVRVLNMPFADPCIRLIPRIQAAGMGVSVWTLNEETPLRRAFGLGVVNVTTCESRRAVELRLQHRASPNAAG